MTRTNLLLLVVLSLVLGVGAWGVGAKVVGALAGNKEEQQKAPQPPIISGPLPDGAWVGDSASSNGGLAGVDQAEMDNHNAWLTTKDGFERVFGVPLLNQFDLDLRWVFVRWATTPQTMKTYMENLVPSVAEINTFFDELAKPETKFAAKTSPDDLKELLDPKDNDEFKATVNQKDVQKDVVFVGIAKDPIKCWFAKEEISEAKGGQAPEPPVNATIDVPGVIGVSCQFPTEGQWKAAFALRDKRIAGMHPPDAGYGEYLQGDKVIGESEQAVKMKADGKWNEVARVKSERVEETKVTNKSTNNWTEEDIKKEIKLYLIEKDINEITASNLASQAKPEHQKVALQRLTAKAPVPEPTLERFSYRWVIESKEMKEAITKAATSAPP